MLGDVEESRCGSEEVAVEILRASHHEPGIVQEWIEFLASPEGLVLGIARASLGLLGDGVKLDGFLHLLYRTLEVARWLGELLVGTGLCRVHEQSAGVVVLILSFKLLERLAVVLGTVVIYVVSGGELLPSS